MGEAFVKKCGNCRWFEAGVCRVPLWEQGIYYPEHPAKEEAVCALYEPAGDSSGEAS